MPKLSRSARAKLPDRAFAYIAGDGTRRLPIHDEAHVRNALARFERVEFEDDAARDRARRRLLNAARRFKIVPVGFVAGQLRADRSVPNFDGFPAGVVTFLMTDIEGSTELVQRLGDGYPRLLRDVRNAIGSSVRRRGGRKVDVHGDEQLSVFEVAAAAVAAAIDIQRALAGRTWPGGVECRVRAGINTGRPTLTDTGYVGLALNTVARIGFVGHGGQILVSRSTRDAVNGPSAEGIRFRSVGTHKLAGLPRPVALFQVHAEGLETRFPALRLR
jgi:class 3 adenylate cyclase